LILLRYASTFLAVLSVRVVSTLRVTSVRTRTKPFSKASFASATSVTAREVVTALGKMLVELMPGEPEVTANQCAALDEPKAEVEKHGLGY
jgi:hypothetical protein